MHFCNNKSGLNTLRIFILIFEKNVKYDNINEQINKQGGFQMAKKKFKIPGLSFSWKRAFGVTKAKRQIAKATGIPTTKSGRRNKLGKMLGIK